MRKVYLSVILLGFLLMAFTLNANAQVEFIIQYDDGASVYYSGRPLPDDTCGVWFEPPTESQVLSGLFQFNDGMGGDADVFVTYLAGDFDEANYFDNNEPGWPGQAPTPLGEFLTPTVIPVTFDDSGDWQEVVFDLYGYSPEDLDVGTDNFFIGYRIVGSGAEPYYPSILGDAADDRPYHSLCYLTEPAGSYPGESGWWAYGIDWMVRAKVNMYGDPPPVVEDVVDPPDTYTAGPYTISATVTDQIVGGGAGVVDEVRLIYTVDGGAENTVIMPNTGGDTYEGDLPAVGVGSLINFRVEADDDQNHTSVAPSITGYYFTYRQPSEAKILLVNDSGDTEGEALYVNTLNDNSFYFDYWIINPGDPGDMGYAGADVFNTTNYRTILWFTGTAHSGYLPDNDADLSTDPIALFMDDGGNFFLTSSDYLGGAFNPDVWTEFTADPGTFMYEYLKVSDGWSDAHIDPGTGESLDTLHMGISGDPISDEFAASGIYNHPDPNYNDYCYPNDGEICFETEIDGESAGIRYDGDYKMVFLPWILEAADDLDQAENLLLNVLEYFNENPGPSIAMLMGSRYGIYANNNPAYPGDTPQRVIVELDDPDGIGGASIQMSWDGGGWQTRSMTDLGSDQYRYIFAETPAGWSTLDYRVKAIDASGNVGMSPTYSVWTTGLEYDGDAGLLFCTDMPYQDYFGHPAYDTTMIEVLDGVVVPGFGYQVWDVDVHGTPDFWTVLNKYDDCIWVGYLDWELVFPMMTADNPFSLFLASGKNLLFSSEEQMGVWTDWVDITFTEGYFAHDWMHIEEVRNDMSYTDITLSDPVDVQCNGLPDPITLQELQYPPMGDGLTPLSWTDPILWYGDGWSVATRDGSDQHNITSLGFCLYQMDPADIDIFIDNVVLWWAMPQNQGYPIGVEPEQNAEPTVYQLNQNYPNPFNPVTQITFALPEYTNVELSVFNLLGQEVARLLDRKMSPGSHSITFDASHLSSGVYFYKLNTANFESIRKMILVK